MLGPQHVRKMFGLRKMQGICFRQHLPIPLYGRKRDLNGLGIITAYFNPDKNVDIYII